MLTVFTTATFVVVVAFAIAVAVGEWWILPVALGVHLMASVFVIRVVLKATQNRDKPDPVTEARLEEEAVEEAKLDRERRRGRKDEERVFRR